MRKKRLRRIAFTQYHKNLWTLVKCQQNPQEHLVVYFMLQFHQLLKVKLLSKGKASSSLVSAKSVQINQLRGFIKDSLWLVLTRINTWTYINYVALWPLVKNQKQKKPKQKPQTKTKNTPTTKKNPSKTKRCGEQEDKLGCIFPFNNSRDLCWITVVCRDMALLFWSCK